MQSLNRKLGSTLLAAAALSWGAAAQAAAAPATDYPTRTVSIVVGYSAGGGSDAVGRMFAQLLSNDLGRSFIVENRPGASGNIAAEYVARANDPHKLLFGVGAHVINASLYPSIPYDPIGDFSPISLIAVAPNVLVASPKLGVSNLKEVIALAKQKPGEITYSSPGNGTPMHMAMALFESMADIELLHVPYGGGGESVTSTLAGHTSLLTMSLPTVLPHIQSGALIPLGVTGRERSPLTPDIPTVEEAADLEGYEALAWYGMLAPATMPPGAVEKLNRALHAQLERPEVQKQLMAQGFVPMPNSPEEFREFLIEDMEKWAKVIKASGVRLE